MSESVGTSVIDTLNGEGRGTYHAAMSGGVGSIAL